VIALMTDRTLRREEARVVGPACDRSAVWQGKRPACPVYADAAAEISTLQGTGTWRGPVLIAADAGTGSAAEDFVVWLQQNGVARVLGERTAGAGCGYVDGGTVTRLSVVPVDVWMPNCSRFLANGTNEVEGIRPDVPLKLSEEKPEQAASKLLAALAKVDLRRQRPTERVVWPVGHSIPLMEQYLH
jgi:C-terminal processing protease CtpA/Prc